MPAAVPAEPRMVKALLRSASRSRCSMSHAGSPKNQCPRLMTLGSVSAACESIFPGRASTPCGCLPSRALLISAAPHVRHALDFAWIDSMRLRTPSLEGSSPNASLQVPGSRFLIARRDLRVGLVGELFVAHLQDWTRAVTRRSVHHFRAHSFSWSSSSMRRRPTPCAASRPTVPDSSSAVAIGETYSACRISRQHRLQVEACVASML